MKENESNFDRLLQRYLSGEVTEEERIRIEAWLEMVKTEDSHNLKLSLEEQEKIFREITAATTPENKSAWWSNRNSLFKVAASLLLITVVSFALWHFSNMSQHNMQTVENVKKTILKDGTIVWLNKGGAVTYKEKKNADSTFRYCRLEGTALFEVAKDKTRPFIIDCEQMRIRVIGTSFYITSNVDSTAISVLTGHVKVTNENGTITDLSPGEKLVTLKNGVTAETIFNKYEVSHFTGGTEYEMNFAGATLQAIAAKLEKKFNRQIAISDAIAKCSINVDLTDHSLEESLQLIAAILDVQLRYTEKQIQITGTGCY